MTLAFVAVSALLGSAAQAQALPPPGGDGDPNLGCLSKVSGSISASPATLTVGQSSLVSWSVRNVPSGCNPTLRVTSVGTVARSGSAYVQPSGDLNGKSTYELRASLSGVTKYLGSVTVNVALPAPVWGRSTVRIDDDSQVNLFIRAISTPNTTVLLADDVNLNLTGRGTLHVQSGVHILGGRSATKAGPRLYTTAIRTEGPNPLFAIGTYLDADGVRIVGVRIDGGDMDIAGGKILQDDDPSTPVAITTNSSINIEIANNEIYGWSGVGVRVLDDRGAGRLNIANSSSVWVHDNYIHHNQRYRHEGYGVQTAAGAHALIERNVFDRNRHALESSGTEGSGYRAYNNLLLEGGGINGGIGTEIVYTHEFDVHGTLDCDFKDAYCGPAGEYYDYRYNTLLYTRGTAIKVRGYPALGAHVKKNVFVHDEGSDAITQTDGGNLRADDNVFSASKAAMLGVQVCDFDGDGLKDSFLATGANWWLRPAGGQQAGKSFFLNTSTQPLSGLTFVQNGASCDVKVSADGSVYRGGRGNKIASSGLEQSAKRSDLLVRLSGGQAKIVRLKPGLDGIYSETNAQLTRGGVVASDAQPLGTGDFNADGAPDLIWRDGSARVWLSLLDADGASMTEGRKGIADRFSDDGMLMGTMPLGTSFEGLGDFNADGRSDILWRKGDGQLLMWLAGEGGNSATVNLNNDITVNPTTGEVKPKEVPVPTAWKVCGIGDFNGDGYSDIQYCNGSESKVVIWYMRHAQHVESSYEWTIGAGWTVQGIGDFDGDGFDDILWRHSSGWLNAWFRPGQAGAHQEDVNSFNRPGYITGPEFTVKGVGDFDADGRSDILWQRNSDGALSIWKMSGATYLGETRPVAGFYNTRQMLGLQAQAPQRISLN
ncbi:FG-GAP-like repeat-containing protein [Kribbella ginsengisoli]|uniref:VCBS repeat protein n=1 Tax=Kribbella ginsengisoli TaxID=363865 RepID=A0ABP6YBJ2_9ACTN